jgi:hypothetical protein
MSLFYNLLGIYSPEHHFLGPFVIGTSPGFAAVMNALISSNNCCFSSALAALETAPERSLTYRLLI